MFAIYHSRADVKKIPELLGMTTLYANTRQIIDRTSIMSRWINWGCNPSAVQGMQAPDTMLNRDISGSLRKMRTFELLDVYKLPHPRVTRNPSELIGDIPFYQAFRYLGRTDGLSRGNGITIYNKGNRYFRDHDFYAEVVNKINEVRIHVASGHIICEQIKFMPRGHNYLIRSYRNGARYTTTLLDRRMDNADDGRKLAIQAVAACGLDFAAVDMATTDQGWTIFELNTAPGIERLEDRDRGIPCSFDAYLHYFSQFV